MKEDCKVNFSWDIIYACNYRCPYCWWHGRWQALSQLNRYLSVEEWVKFWRNIYNRYGSVHIEVLGGEPFIYPHFIELSKELSQMHTLNITTNLSIDIRDFAQQLDPDMIKVIPTFHPLFSHLDTFIQKARILKEKGFIDNVLYLAYPPQIKFIDFYRRKFEAESLIFSVLTFWGKYNGIDYPSGYTDEEKFLIAGCLGDRAGEKFQVAPKRDLKGRLCHAGHSYAVIQGDGKVIRCGGSDLNEVIGNFFDENFKLLDKALPCNAEFCKCNEWAFLIEKDGPHKDDSDDEAKVSGLTEGKSIVSQHDQAPGDTQQCNASTEDESKKIAEKFLKNREKNIRETCERKIILESKPVRLGIIITNWCNLRCIMCPPQRHRGGFTFPLSVLCSVEELLPYLERIDWQGGEFFGFEHVKKMFVSMKNYPHIQSEITTNGLLLDEEWIRLLFDINVTTTFSIDSSVKEEYEYIRSGAKYNDLVDRLNLILELENACGNKFKRGITVVVMRSNYRHLDQFIPFVEKYGFGHISFNPVMYIETDENIFRDPQLDYRYLNETMNYLKEQFGKLKVNFVWNLPQRYDEVSAQQNTYARRTGSELYCNLPWKSLWVIADRDGDVLPDCWCRESIGNIYHNTLLEIWNNQKMQEYRRKIVENDFSICNPNCICDYSAHVSTKLFDI